MSETAITKDRPKVVTGNQTRRAAKWCNYGTLISLILLLPLMIFWTGMSMLIYALNRHHPSSKVGDKTCTMAYRL
ncbi:MAG TPA: hypothetical protein ENN02_03695 [Halothiobacillus sp.]|nr:hypothetical protein [Halothiobacillus sp.]